MGPVTKDIVTQGEKSIVTLADMEPTGGVLFWGRKEQGWE